ncbi:MAG: hypothetical protein WBA91_10240, partial [Paracoccaceae bacterium]
LPVVGSAFRQKANEVKRTELLIFIRPLVVRDSREAGEVTDEFRRRLRKPTPLTRREIHRRDFDRVVR